MPIRKKTSLYLVAIVLLVTGGCFFFNKAYQELVQYNEFTGKFNTIYSCFQNLSAHISNAVEVNGTPNQATGAPAINSLFLSDSQSIIHQLKLVQSTTGDAILLDVTKKLLASVDSARYPAPNVRLTDQSNGDKTQSNFIPVKYIQALIHRAIQRTDFLLAYYKRQQTETFSLLRMWIIFIIILTGGLLVYTSAFISRQRSKSRKQERDLEHANRLLKNAQQIGGIGSWDLNMETGRLNCSDELYHIWGISGGDFSFNNELFANTIHPHDLEIFKRAQHLSLPVFEEHDIEYRILLPDGTVKWIHQRSRCIEDLIEEGTIIEGTVQDITWRKETGPGLKHTDIRQTLVSALLNSSKDAIISETTDGKITSWNKGAEMIFGYTAKQVIGKPVSFLLPEEVIGEANNILGGKAGSLLSDFEVETVRQDGGRLKLLMSVSSILDLPGNISGTLRILSDVTEINKMANALRQNELKFQALFENSLDAILLTSPDGSILAANQAACQVFKMTGDEICTGGREGLVDRADSAHALFLEEHAQLGQAKGEFIFIRKGGERFPGELVSFVYTDQSGEVGACIIIRDMTDRNKTAEELKISEKLFRALIENTNDIISLVNASFKIIYRSPSAFRITGWTNEEMNNMDGRANVHPDDKQQITEIIQELMTNPGGTRYILFRMQHKDGHYMWMEGVFKNLLEERYVNALVFNYRDVTARVITEANLEKSEKRFRALVENNEGIIAMLDKDLHPVYRSPSAWRITGYDRNETARRTTMDDIHPDDIPAFKSALEKVMDSPNLAIFTSIRIRHKTGSYIWLEGTFTNMFDDRDVGAVVVNLRDITKRKVAEKRLKESELHYRSVIAQATDAIYIVDASLKYIDINPSGSRMLGYSREEFLRLTPMDIVAEEDYRANASKLPELMCGRSVSYQQKVKKKNGERVDLEVNAKMMEDGAFIMIARDITDRKNEDLQKALLAEISLLFTKSADLKEVLKKVTQRLGVFGGFIMAEAWVVGHDRKNIHLVARHANSQRMEDFYNESQERTFAIGEDLPGITWQNNTMQFWQNSTQDKKFVRRQAAKAAGLKAVYGVPIKFNDEVTAVFVFGFNTNRYQSRSLTTLFENLSLQTGPEIKRKQLEQELNQIFSFAPDIIAIVSVDGYFKKINPAASELLGYTAQELLAVPFTDFIHPDDRIKTQDEVRDMAIGLPTNYIENRYITKSGKIKWLAWTSNLSPGHELIYSIAKDITAKKELEELFIKVNTVARMGGWEVDLVKGTVYWSDITKDLHEVAHDFVPDISAALNFYKEGESRDFIKQKISEAIATGESWDEELLIVTAKGNERWIRIIGEAEMLNSSCVRMYGSFQDIDQRKKVELELQHTIKSFEDYKFALDQSCIVAITDEKGLIIYTNDNFSTISAYGREELLGKTHRVVNSGYHTAKFFSRLWNTVSSGTVWRGEIRNKTKDGVYYWVDTTIVPFLGKNNLPLQYLAISFDVTDKKLATQSVIKTLGEKNTILESIGDAFFAADKNWIVTYWNRVAELVLHTSKNNVVGHPLWQLFSKGIDAVAYEKFHEAVETNTAVNFEDYYKPLDKWFEVSAYPSENGLSVYFKDITDRKLSEIHLNELNKNLQEQARELAASNGELEQFAYVASHDLQEPLRMVTSFLTQLNSKYGSTLDDTGRRYIHFAVDGAKRMRQIILDLLEFSRVGRTDNDKEMIDLNELVYDIRILFIRQIQERGAVIKAGRLPVIRAYRTPLRQVFQNLIGNGLKYTHTDISPIISIDAIELTSHWQFTISDNGIGIEAEYFDKIFEIFQRLHTKEEFAGTGMGLAITRKIIEHLGGKIWVESEEGKGSTFYFTLLKN